MFRKVYTLSFLAIVGAMLMFTSAKAQMMGGNFSLEAELDGGKVNLSWEKPERFNVSYYLVYRTQVSVSSDTGMNFNFTEIDSTTGTSYQDTTTFSANTVVVYLVKAFNGLGGVKISNFAKVYVGSGIYGKDKVTITSTPPLSATLDSLYTYQVQAVSSDSTAVLTYRLGEDHPTLMTMDPTGLITWIPQSRGWHDVDIVVTSSKGGRAKQEYAIRVATVNGTIAGTVTDSISGKPLSHVLIRLYQREKEQHFDYHAVTDSNGNYAIHHVDVGKYLVRAIPLNPNYVPQWYNGANDIQNATAISVTDTIPKVANFELRNKFSLLPKFIVSGTVTDSSGSAVKGAWVVFARADFSFNSSREDQNQWEEGENYRDMFEQAASSAQNMQMGHSDRDFSLDGNSQFVSKTYVDSNGVYSDTLTQGLYIAFAKAPRYDRVFYDGHYDFLSANGITVDSNLTGINFVLSLLPNVALGQITGTVMDSTSGAGVASRIIAFRDVWTYHDTLHMHVAGAYFTDADSTGNYTLNSLPPGYYKVLAVPLGAFAPSFYSLTGPTTLWKLATAVAINGNSSSGINIYVMPLSSSAMGYTYITGNVNSMSSTAPQGVEGGMVYATDSTGAVVGYGITDSTGSYTIHGLAPGIYNVYADAVGFTSGTAGAAQRVGSYTTDAVGYGSIATAASPTYDAAGNPVPGTASFTLTPEAVTAVHEKVIQPTNYSLDQNYPNPFNPTTQIAFNIPLNEHVTVTIYNILGQRIATLLDGNLSAGVHVVTWNAKNQNGEILPTGVYFYRLSTPNFTAVKKMLLLK